MRHNAGHICDLRNWNPRVDLREEAQLTLIDVSDSGEVALIEQGHSDFDSANALNVLDRRGGTPIRAE